MTSGTERAPYFERVGPFRVLAGAFLFVFVPLTALSLVPNFSPWVPYLIIIESIGLGVTHFFITLAVFLRSQDRNYFASSTRTRLIYFVAPALIAIGFGLFAALRAEANYPVFTMWLFAAIRLADFFHVGRQSFGMLQIWKHPAGDELPRWLRPAENVFFVGMALLQLESYMLGERFRPQLLAATLPATALFLVFLAIAYTYLRAVDRGLEGKALRPLAYFCMQATCGAAAVYQTRLYLIALVLHYVEYHMIMAPRCFYTPVTEGSRVDRVSALLRPRVVLFYALLVAVVVLFEGRNHLPGNLPTGTLFFVHLFDGIFVVHYLLDAFLWRFGDPHYGKSLLPLYARPWREVSGEATRKGYAPALGLRSAVALAAVVTIALGSAYASGHLTRATAYLARTVGGPAHAEQQYEFALGLANSGDLDRARAHLRSALAHQPGDQRAQSMLMQLDRHRASRPGPR